MTESIQNTELLLVAVIVLGFITALTIIIDTRIVDKKLKKSKEKRNKDATTPHH